MPQLVQYQNGVTIEVAESPDRTLPASSATVTRLSNSFDAAVKALEPLLRPVHETIHKVLADSQLREAEIKLGVGFTAEGNVFVTKAKAETNLEITLKFGLEKK